MCTKRPTEAGSEGIFIACNRGSDKCLDPDIAFVPTRTTRFEPLAQNQVWLLGTELGVTSQHFQVCPVPKETQNASARELVQRVSWLLSCIQSTLI